MTPPTEAAIPSPSATLKKSVADVGTAASNTLKEMLPNCSIESSSNSAPSSNNDTDASFPLTLVKENKSRKKLLISPVSRGESSEAMARVSTTPAGTVIERVDITAISKSVRFFIISLKLLVSCSTCGKCFSCRLPFIKFPIDVKSNLLVFGFGFGSFNTKSEVEVGVGSFLFNVSIFWCIGLNARVTTFVANAITATSLEFRLLPPYFIKT